MKCVLESERVREGMCKYIYVRFSARALWINSSWLDHMPGVIDLSTKNSQTVMESM